MKIISLKSKTKKVKEFNKLEWKLVHPKHFGKEQDEKYWDKKKFFFKAEDKGEILGTLDGSFMAGVMSISQLIVVHDKKRLGIGKKLMDVAEKLARRNKLHMIFLKTGVGWKAVKFYESLGYKSVAKLKNFYSKKDFWLMTKRLDYLDNLTKTTI